MQMNLSESGTSPKRTAHHGALGRSDVGAFRLTLARIFEHVRREASASAVLMSLASGQQ